MLNKQTRRLLIYLTFKKGLKNSINSTGNETPKIVVECQKTHEKKDWLRQVVRTVQGVLVFIKI